MLSFARIIGIPVLVVDASITRVADPIDNPAEGHRLALKICSACHVVSADQEEPPLLLNPAPSFELMARRPDVSVASLRNFLMTIRRTLTNGTGMPDPELTDDQATDIASYIQSLRPEISRPKP